MDIQRRQFAPEIRPPASRAAHSPTQLDQDTPDSTVMLDDVNKHVADSASRQSKDRKPGRLKRILTAKSFYLTLLLVGTIGTTGYLYTQVQYLRKNPQVANEASAKDTVKRVGALMELPKDEDPSVQTVTNKEQLADVPFFKDAKVDDKLLVYNKQNKAILFRPSENRIINVAPAYANSLQLRIAIITSDEASARADEINKKILSTYNNVSIAKDIQKTDASITAVTVVDISGQNSPAAEQLASELGCKTGSLPDGITAPADVDLLVVVGDQ